MNTVFNIADVEISSDTERLDLAAVYDTLSKSYWAENIPFELMARSVRNSICYGGYWQQQQIAFARVVTDQATFAYLADVYVLDEFSGQGVAKKLLSVIMDDERMMSVRRFCLATRDAHSLYEPFGFESFSERDRSRFMQLRRVEKYPDNG